MFLNGSHAPWGEPPRWHNFFVHSFRFGKSVLASSSRRRGLGKGTAIESHSPVTLLPQAQPFRVSCATCTGIAWSLPIPGPTPLHRRRSSCAPRPSAEISGSTVFSSRWFLSRKLCPILCVISRVHSTVPIPWLELRTGRLCPYRGRGRCQSA